MALPVFHTDDKDFQMMQTRWASELNPALSNPLMQGSILTNVSLVTGANVINHLLGRKLVGWIIVRQRAAASIYDTQDANPTPTLTLTLTSSANVTCDIEVF